MFFLKADDGMRSVLYELSGVCFGDAADVTGEFDGGDLHAEADSEVGDFVFASVLRGEDFSFRAAFAEAAGDENAIDFSDDGFGSFFFDIFGVHFDDFNGGVVFCASDGEAFVN